MTVSISESTKFGATAAADLRLDRAAIEAAIRGNLFLASYGDVPAVNGVTVAAEAIVALADMQAAAVRQALEEARDLLLERRRGNAARSPAHNARLVLDRALSTLSRTAPGAAA